MVGANRTSRCFEGGNEMRLRSVLLQGLGYFAKPAGGIFDVEHRTLDLAEVAFLSGLLSG